MTTPNQSMKPTPNEFAGKVAAMPGESNVFATTASFASWRSHTLAVLFFNDGRDLSLCR
jgi:hypothetical protein